MTLLGGLVAILLGLLCLLAFVACVARAEAQRPDLTPGSEPRTGPVATVWLAACLLLIPGGVLSLLVHVVSLY